MPQHITPAALCCRSDTLVAGGGDGTLNELVAALLKHDAPAHISIAQLPLGTANDLASASGISLVRKVCWWMQLTARDAEGRTLHVVASAQHVSLYGRPAQQSPCILQGVRCQRSHGVGKVVG
jgi:diacylglycerol kinase family enzyme